jgi:hypothetical protein
MTNPASAVNIPASAGGGTFPIATGPCTLVALAVNTPGSGSVITLFDNGVGAAAGPVVAKVTCPAGQTPFSIPYNIPLKNGLVAAVATAASDFTITTQVTNP